jgi:hypothetical protein
MPPPLIDRSAHVGDGTKNVLLHLFFEVKGPLLQQTSEIGNGRSSIREVKDKERWLGFGAGGGLNRYSRTTADPLQGESPKVHKFQACRLTVSNPLYHASLSCPPHTAVVAADVCAVVGFAGGFPAPLPGHPGLRLLNQASVDLIEDGIDVALVGAIVLWRTWPLAIQDQGFGTLRVGRYLQTLELVASQIVNRGLAEKHGERGLMTAGYRGPQEALVC